MGFTLPISSSNFVQLVTQLSELGTTLYDLYVTSSCKSKIAGSLTNWISRCLFALLVHTVMSCYCSMGGFGFYCFTIRAHKNTGHHAKRTESCKNELNIMIFYSSTAIIFTLLAKEIHRGIVASLDSLIHLMILSCSFEPLIYSRLALVFSQLPDPPPPPPLR